VAPDGNARVPGALYVRADLNDIPLKPGRFEVVVSFQVIEHLPDPGPYLRAIATALVPAGTALITTPNRLTSDGENPYHVHEYVAAELEECLRSRFDEVELRGIGATPAVARYLNARLERIRLITRLDPLQLRRRLPRPLVEWLFARFALVVRRRIQRREELPAATPQDFPIGAPDDRCVDLLAICRRPRV
jgi:SAM-dependent methyltransferase